jgi:hypothetical protein
MRSWITLVKGPPPMAGSRLNFTSRVGTKSAIKVARLILRIYPYPASQPDKATAEPTYQQPQNKLLDQIG